MKNFLFSKAAAVSVEESHPPAGINIVKLLENVKEDCRALVDP